MSSKINDIGGGRSGPVGAGRAVTRARDSAAEKNEPAREATDVQITGKARQLAALEQAITSLPVVDDVRVAQIRLAIENGQYKISPERIASELLQMEHSLTRLPGEKK